MAAAGAQDEPMVGSYRLLNRLGEGGMGVVHLAVGPDDRAVAIKLLKAHVAADPDARLRLAREVDTLRRIRHPRVAEVLDADTDGPVPFVVTRFVPGRTLDDLVRERGPMPIERVVHSGRALAEALRSIHAAGVVHRDVKPANIMLVDDEPVLIDFGIAHLADESRITMTGLVMGTPGYLSPEVVAGSPVTPATDWWGWGSTLAFAATGRPPFGTGPIEVVLDRVRRGAADLSGLDERLASVVATALSVEPGTRPPADWLVGALEDVLLQRAAGGRRLQAAPPPAGSPTVLRPPGAVPGNARDAAAAAPTVAGRPPVASTVPAWSPAAPTVPARPPALPVPPGAGTAAGRPRPAPTLIDAAGRRPGRSGRPVPAAPATAVAVRPPAQPPAQPAAPAAPEPLAAPPPERPSLLLLTGLVALAMTATVAPGAAIVILWLWMIVARTTDRSALGLWRRRYAYGPRPTDLPIAVVLAPGRALLSAVMSTIAIVAPLAVGASLAFLVGSALTGGTTLRTPTHPVALALAAIAAGLTAWLGPGGSSMRRGSTWLAGQAVRRRPLYTGLMVFFGFVVVAALLVLGTNPMPDFTPFMPPSG